MKLRSIVSSLPLVGMLALGLSGCGSAVLGPGDAGADGSSGEGGTTFPASITIAPDPSNAYFRVNSTVHLTATVRDEAGNVIPNAEARWSVDNTQRAMMVDAMGNFQFLSEGRVRFTGCAVQRTRSGQELCDTAVVLVDAGAPTLQITSPTAGAELGAMGMQQIQVQGMVSEPAARVYVNGTAATVNAMGGFTAMVLPQYGINHITATATDGVTEEARQELDVLWANAYQPATNMNRPELKLDDGVVLQLGQRFFDDAQPVLNPAMRPLMLNDLADILQVVVSALDLRAQIPNPLVNMPPTLTLSVTNIRPDDIRVSLTVLNDGIDLFIRVGNLSVDTSGSLNFMGTNLSLLGGFNAAVSAYAKLTLRKTSPTAMVEVNLTQFRVALEDLSSRFQAPEANAVFALASSLLRTQIETQVRTALQGTLNSTIPSVLRDLFNTIDTALQNRTIPLNQAPLPMVTINIDGRISQLVTTYQDHLRASLQTTTGTDRTMLTFPNSRGVALIDPVTTDVPLFEAPRVQLGVRHAMLNGLLHNLWNSGLLELNASALLPDNIRALVTSAVISGKIQPIIRLPRAGEPYDLYLSIGQLELTAVSQGVTRKFGMNLEAGMNLTVANNRIAISIANEPTVNVWNATPPPPGPALLSPTVLRTVVLTQLWPSLRMSFASGLSFDLPIPAITNLGTIAPSVGAINLQLGMNDRITYRRGFLVLDASLGATLGM